MIAVLMVWIIWLVFDIVDRVYCFLLGLFNHIEIVEWLT